MVATIRIEFSDLAVACAGEKIHVHPDAQHSEEATKDPSAKLPIHMIGRFGSSHSCDWMSPVNSKIRDHTAPANLVELETRSMKPDVYLANCSKEMVFAFFIS